MKKHLITGAVILLPLALTIALVSFVFNLLTKPFVGSVQAVLNHHHLLDHNIWFFSVQQISEFVSQVIILLLLVLFTAFLGLITRWFFIHSLLRLWDRILHKIPLISTIYKASQDIINTIFTNTTQSFKQVVLVPFPNKDTLSVGLVTRDDLPSPKGGGKMFAVFVPTTPNPTSGFLLIFSKEELIFLDMKVEEALKYVISCGVIMSPFNTISPPEGQG